MKIIKYLGINLPKKRPMYGKLMKEIKDDTNRWRLINMHHCNVIPGASTKTFCLHFVSLGS